MELAAFMDKYGDFMASNPDLSELSGKLSDLLVLREKADKAAE